MQEKSFSELLNAYLAIEALLGSRYTSDDTRKRAYETLKLLNQQLAQLLELEEEKSQPADKAA
ncbi:MAG: hypothetical protein ACXVZV_00675 [Terriglobales bacterium]